MSTLSAPRTARTTLPEPGRAIPLTRLVAVELRKMFDTRAGLWLMILAGVSGLIATVAVIIFAPDSALEYGNFAAAVGTPLAIVLPVIAILAVTSEWSQRTGLVTFSLEPRRGRVVLAKWLAVLTAALASIVLALVVGALGNVLGAAIAGIDATWDFGLVAIAQVALAQILGMSVGFAFGALFLNSPAAIVTYFALSFVVNTLSALLASLQEWYADIQPWIDLNAGQTPLFSGEGLTGEQWGHVLTTSLIWIGLPLVFGVRRILRAEIK